MNDVEVKEEIERMFYELPIEKRENIKDFLVGLIFEDGEVGLVCSFDESELPDISIRKDLVMHVFLKLRFSLTDLGVLP